MSELRIFFSGTPVLRLLGSAFHGPGVLAWIIHEPTAADADLPISAALR